jgi:hypothetical protein
MEEVHDLVYHGQGGFTYSDVWEMPVTTRRYHINKILEYLKKKAEVEEKATKGNTQPAKSSKVNVPDFISNVKKK